MFVRQNRRGKSAAIGTVIHLIYLNTTFIDIFKSAAAPDSGRLSREKGEKA